MIIRKQIIVGILLVSTTTLLSMEENTLKLIKDRYQLSTADKCKIEISKERKDPTAGKDLEYTANYQIASIIVGFKDVYMMTFDPEKEFASMDPLLKGLVQNKERINYFILRYPNLDPQNETERLKSIGFIFTPKGERNAYLLGKHTLEVALKGFSNNPYLTGVLLKYSEIDEESFYKINDFLDYRMEQGTNRDESISVSNYIEWPLQVKKDFEDFEQTVWPSRNLYKGLVQDRESAKNWLAWQEKRSLSELKADITQLTEKIKKKRNKAIQKSIFWHEESIKVLKADQSFLSDLKTLTDDMQEISLNTPVPSQNTYI